MRKNAQRNVIIGLILLVAALYLIISSGISLSTLSIAGVPGGVTVSGLGSVSVLSNYAGLAGPWWLAAVSLGGGQTLNVQNLSGANFPANAINTNSSYICGTSCQKNNIQFSVLHSWLDYGASSAGIPIDVYYISYLTKASSITYQSCIGNSLGGVQTTTTATNQQISFENCLGSVQTSYANYNAACTSAGGNPFGSGPTFTTGNGGQEYQSVGCYQLNTIAYANIYGLSSPATQYTIKATVDTQSVVISNNQSNNATNPNFIITNLGSGFTPQQDPSETTISLLQYLPLSGAVGGIVNVVPAYTAKIEGGSSTGLGSTESAFMSGLQGTFPQEPNLAAAYQAVNLTNKNLAGALVASYVNTPFQNASILYASTGETGEFYTTSGSVTGVMLPDQQMLYTRPNLILQIKASSVGLYEGVTTINITSISIPTFRSGSTTTATVAITNTGNAQGGYTISFNSTSSSSGLTSSSYQSGILGVKNQTTANFTINDNANINANAQQSIAFTACPNPQIAGSKCSTMVKSFTLEPACKGTQQLNNGNCTALTTITTPTTTTQTTTTICQNVLGCGGTTTATTVTTTIPCNPYNVTGTCGPTMGGWTDTDTLIVIAIIAVIAIAYLATRKKGGRSVRRRVGPPFKLTNNMLYLIFGIVIFVILGIYQLIGWAILGAFILGGLYVVSKIFHINLVI